MPQVVIGEMLSKTVQAIKGEESQGLYLEERPAALHKHLLREDHLFTPPNFFLFVERRLLVVKGPVSVGKCKAEGLGEGGLFVFARADYKSRLEGLFVFSRADWKVCLCSLEPTGSLFVFSIADWERDSLSLEPSNVANCVSKGKSEVSTGEKCHSTDSPC
uniref:Uncharacterized protein n=1 Tax=Timema tahoe TaxID=61484 RepID=A0A7R9P0F0_9NEOP|nr:unnamed protein product [Timema tahoe]